MRTPPLFFAVFFALSLLQVSFMPHFSVAGWVLNLPLLLLVASASFAGPPSGTAASLAGGFVLDLYSSLPFGFWIALSLLVFFAAKHILQHYVRVPQGV